MSGWLRKLDTVLLAIIASIAIVVVVVHFFHLAKAEEINPAVPALLTLFFLAVVAIHLVDELPVVGPFCVRLAKDYLTVAVLIARSGRSHHLSHITALIKVGMLLFPHPGAFTELIHIER